MSWKSAGKTVIKLPLRVERRAAKRLEAQKLKALQESGTAYPKGNRDLPPIISCRRPELNHYFGQKYNPYTGKLPLASEHWPSRRSIGDYFSFAAFRGPPATQWHKILQRKLERQQRDNDDDTSEILAMAEEKGLLIFKGGKYNRDFSKVEKPTFRSSPYCGEIDATLLNSIENCGFKYPTNIQDIAIPTLLTGESAIIAAETGNGKTLAFLIPVLQRSMKIKSAMRKAASAEKSKYHSEDVNNHEQYSKFNSLLNHKNRPLAVIVAPSRELAKQIYETAISINKAATSVTNASSMKNEQSGNNLSEEQRNATNVSGLDLRMRLVLGGNVDQRIETEDKSGVDILIGTIGALHKMFTAKHYYAGSVCSLVLDEVDSLIDDTFGNLTSSLLTKLCRVKPEVTELLSLSGSKASEIQIDGAIGETQVLLVGATMPSNLSTTPIGSIVEADQLKVLRTGQLHKVLPHVYQKFIRAPKLDRQKYLISVIEKDIAKKKPIIIFSNKASTANFIAHTINNHFNSKKDSEEFLQPNASPKQVCIAFNSSVYWKKRDEVLAKFINGEINVLSCTDLASRGLDLGGKTTHVINYDFPSNMSDYLHRVGRVGRVGQSEAGKVTNLVCGQTSIAVVQELELSVRLNQEISNINSNIRSIIHDRHSSKLPNESLS